MQRIVLLVIVCIFSPTVFAHHPLNGLPMETMAHGFLSGLGHPILGFDHLFFVVLVGIASVFTAQRYLTPMIYILAMLLGCFVASAGVLLPARELMISLSLLIVGGIVCSGRDLTPAMWLFMFAGFGLFHGSAFGETLATQEAGFEIVVLIGYLSGLAIMQTIIATAAGWTCINLCKSGEPNAFQMRLTGAMVAGAGLLLTLEVLESALFNGLAG